MPTTKEPEHPISTFFRVMRRIDNPGGRTGNTCWEWQGAKNKDGYGCIWANGQAHYVHRISFAVVKGPIPEGRTVDHLCRNRACARPSHMEAVTPAVNVLRGDGPSARNARKTHCLRGHPFAGANLAITKRGHRRCRECERNRRRTRR